MWILSKHSKQLALANSQLESEILRRMTELQSLTQRLLKIQDEEKRKLARDLHDSTGQTLVALKISVSFLEEHCRGDETAMGYVSDVAKLADEAVAEIRTMSYLLHPPLMDELGFACAAEWYAEGFAKRSGVSVSIDIVPPRERMPMNVEIALFRVLQESLTNANRHSGASEISVQFRQLPEKIILEIRDHGCGIPADRFQLLTASSADSGVGLAGMRERLLELNGLLEIESSPSGTNVRATVPLIEVSLPAPDQSFERPSPSTPETLVLPDQLQTCGSRPSLE